MTTNVDVKIVGHAVLVQVWDHHEGRSHIAYEKVYVPGQEVPPYELYATTTREIRVRDLEPVDKRARDAVEKFETWKQARAAEPINSDDAA